MVTYGIEKRSIAKMILRRAKVFTVNSSFPEVIACLEGYEMANSNGGVKPKDDSSSELLEWLESDCMDWSHSMPPSEQIEIIMEKYCTEELAIAEMSKVATEQRKSKNEK